MFFAEIRSDDTMDLMRQLSSLKITHCLSSVYYPQANGAVERWNSVLKNAVQNAVVKKESIKENVLQLIACYCVTPHATTGEKPCKLLHGRDMRTKLDIAGFQKKRLTERSRFRESQGQSKA